MSEIKLKNTKRIPLLWKVNGQQTRKIVVQQSFTGKMTREDMKKKANALSKTMQDKGITGKIAVAIDYGDGEWRSGYFTDFGAPVMLHEWNDSGDQVGTDPAHFTNMAVFALRENPARGGCSSKMNDCAWDCLDKLLGDDSPFATPADLKKFLKLKRTDKVPIEMMSNLERKLKTYKINVTGDHTYTSTKDCNMEVRLKLLNEHYTVDTDHRPFVHGVSYKEKKILMVMKNKNGAYDTYDGSELKEMLESIIQTHRKDRQSPYIVVKAESAIDPTTNKRIPIEQQYKTYVDGAKALKKASPMLNLFKQHRLAAAAMDLMDRFTKTITPEEIRQDEAEWLRHASIGSIIFCEKYKGPAYQYDYSSFYPSLMKDQFNLVPIARGDFAVITQADIENKSSLPFGIYRCTISYDDKHKKLFRWNDLNYYCHRDVCRAIKLGLTVTMIDDGKPNRLHYSRNKCVTGKQLFGKFVDFVFALKQAKVPFAKNILNSLWGALCQKKEIEMTVHKDKETVLDEDAELIKIHPLPNDNTLISFVKKRSVYSTNYARVGPFLLSFGRTKMSETIEPHQATVIRCHTDSMISTVPLNVETGNDIGDLKYEGHCPELHIMNNVKKTGKFTV